MSGRGELGGKREQQTSAILKEKRKGEKEKRNGN